METITTTNGTIKINEGCPSVLRECAILAVTNPMQFSFKTLVLCDQYDDEVRRDCRLALDGMLTASPDELVIAKRIWDNFLSVEEAQALLQ